MYFKRPSFRRGGSTGIGQLTPRKNFQFGTPGFNFLESGLQNELRAQNELRNRPGIGTRTVPGGRQNIPTSGLTKGTRGARLLTQLRNLAAVPSAKGAGLAAGYGAGIMAIPAGLAYMNRPRTLEEKKVMQDYGMLDETFGLAEDYNKVMKDRLDARKVGDEISFTDAIFMDTETGKYPKILGRTEDREIEEELYGTDAGFLPTPRFDSDQTVNMESIVEEMVPNKKIDDDTPKEPTFEDTYEKEKSRIEKLLGDDDQKGMAAIALSEAIGTPGTIADKAAVLNKSLLGIMVGKKKDKKDIAKLAYTATKEIEKAKIMAGKEGFSEKNYKKMTQLQKIISDTTGTYNEAQKKAAAAEYAIAEKVISSIGGKKGTEGLTTADIKILGNINDLVKEIQKHKGKNEDKYRAALAKLARAKATLQGMSQFDSAIAIAEAEIGGTLFKKDGGRIGFANGTPMEESIQVSETVGQGEVPTAQTPQLSFEEIRNRLPKEITDEVVKLIAGSNEALQDFSYIRTQGDVDKFNMKYGVTLVLPQSTA